MRQLHQIQGLNRPVMCVSAQQCPVFPLSDVHVLLTGGPLRKHKMGTIMGSTLGGILGFQHRLWCVINNLHRQQSFLLEPVLYMAVCCRQGTAGRASAAEATGGQMIGAELTSTTPKHTR